MSCWCCNRILTREEENKNVPYFIFRFDASPQVPSSKENRTSNSYTQKFPNVLLFGLGPPGSNRKNFLHLFFSPKSCFSFVVSKESYGGETLFVPDVDYFGDP